MGYEETFVKYYDDPGLIHDIISTLTEVWIAIYEEVLSSTDIDHVQIWEDISAGTGSMVSPEKSSGEFMIPDVQEIHLVSPGSGSGPDIRRHRWRLLRPHPPVLGRRDDRYVPDGSELRDGHRPGQADFPDLIIMGGIQKSELVFGKKRIDEVAGTGEAVLKTGGYIPFCDHFIPP